MGLHLFRFGHTSGAKNVRNKTEKSKRFFGPGTIIAACFLLYTSMMASKGVFLAEIAYLMEEFAVDKATASLTNTWYFVAYAGAQVLLFFIIKRLNIKKFLLFTVPLSAVAVMLMGLSRGIYDMYVLFAICGIFQAGVYAGCNATLTSCLPACYLSRANSVMNFGYATGTVISYAFCAVCVRMTLWRIPFFVMGGFLLVCVIFYFICAVKCSNLKNEEKETVDQSVKPLPEEAFIKVGRGRKKALFYVVDLILVFFITVLYYAVMNWISTLLVEIHHLSQDISIYITILAPALISLGPVMTIRSCDRDRDFVKVGMKYMLAVLPIPLLLSFLYNVNVIVAFVLSVVFVIVVNGVKAIVLSIIAFKLREEVNTAEYCVISNATASLAGGIAPTVVGSIIDSHGWSVSYLVIFAISLFVFVSIAVTDAVVVKAKKKNGKVNLEN